MGSSAAPSGAGIQAPVRCGRGRRAGQQVGAGVPAHRPAPCRAPAPSLRPGRSGRPAVPPRAGGRPRQRGASSPTRARPGPIAGGGKPDHDDTALGRHDDSRCSLFCSIRFPLGRSSVWCIANRAPMPHNPLKLRWSGSMNYLEFEKPLAEIERQGHRAARHGRCQPRCADRKRGRRP